MGGAIDLVALIDRSLNEKSITAAEASRLAGGNPWLIYNLRKGVTPKYDTLKRLCDALGIEFYIGDPRPDAPHPEADSAQTDWQEATAALNQALVRAEEAADTVARWPVTSGAAIKFPTGRPVPVRELQTAAGAGTIDLDESITGYVYFRASWLRKYGLKAGHCSIIGVTGDSMEPTLFDGSMVLLNHDRRERRAGGIFAVRAQDGLIVKRARKAGSGEWLLASDNPAWEPAPWPEEADIVGQVIWTARTLI